MPHCFAHDALADGDAGTDRADDAAAPEAGELLLNLDDGCPPHFERFERLLEVVGQDDDARRQGASVTAIIATGATRSAITT